MTDDEQYAAARLRALVADSLAFEREQGRQPEADRTVRVGDERTDAEKLEIWRLTHDDDLLEQAEIKRILSL